MGVGTGANLLPWQCVSVHRFLHTFARQRSSRKLQQDHVVQKSERLTCSLRRYVCPLPPGTSASQALAHLPCSWGWMRIYPTVNTTPVQSLVISVTCCWVTLSKKSPSLWKSLTHNMGSKWGAGIKWHNHTKPSAPKLAIPPQPQALLIFLLSRWPRDLDSSSGMISFWNLERMMKR